MKTKLLPFISSLLLGQIAFAQTVQLFGTTILGGNSNYGTLFSISNDGSGFNDNYFMIKSLGISPIGGVLEASNHLLYGTDAYGGANDTGVIYSYNPASGIYTDLHDFSLPTGAVPQLGNLALATDGKFYGMAALGGANDSGVIFSFDPSNNEYTDVHDFTGPDGKQPVYGSLLQASDGYLYGTVTFGGNAGDGVLFKFNPSNNQYTVLQNFTGSNGSIPFSNLVEAGNNKIYGATNQGGVNDSGEIFSYDISNNIFTDNHDFAGSDGKLPYPGLMLASNGKLYGNTSTGGLNQGGVIFSFDPSNNQLNVLFNFSRNSTAVGPLLQGPDGKLYATTNAGGANGVGMIYSFTINSNQLIDLHDFDTTDGARPGIGGLTIYNPILGISPVNEVHFTASPVPSNGVVNINCPSSMNEIKVTDVLGRVVEDVRPHKTESTLKINKAGVYFILVKSGNISGMKKLIVYK